MFDVKELIGIEGDNPILDVRGFTGIKGDHPIGYFNVGCQGVYWD